MGQSAVRAREPWGLWDVMLMDSLPDKPVAGPFAVPQGAEQLAVEPTVAPAPKVVMWDQAPLEGYLQRKNKRKCKIGLFLIMNHRTSRRR